MVLLLSLQLRSAIHYMQTIESLQVDAVHLAVSIVSNPALLEECSKSDAEGALGDPSALVLEYAKALAGPDPAAAIEYYYIAAAASCTLRTLKGGQACLLYI